MRPSLPTVSLPDGEVGYCVDPSQSDTCFQAAIATVLQVPSEQVPNLGLDQQVETGRSIDEITRMSWKIIENWLFERGLGLRFHDCVPVPLDRWIGVTPEYPDAPFSSHCLVMSHNRLVLDPSVSIKAPRGFVLKRWRPEEISYGISFEKEEQ